MSVEVGAACHYTTKNILDKSHISLKKGNNEKNMVKIIKMAPFMIMLEGTHFLYSNKYSKRHHFELGENPNLRNVGKIISCQLLFMLYKKTMLKSQFSYFWCPTSCFHTILHAVGPVDFHRSYCGSWI